VKGVNFYGPKSEFVVSGSDCGNVFLWDRKSEAIVNIFHADEGGVVSVYFII
jgi:WD repeat-containing protein 42A